MILTETLVVDVSKPGWEALLPADGVINYAYPTGPALHIKSTAPFPYDNVLETIRNLKLIGPGRGHRDSIGIFFDAAAFVGLEDVVIRDFGRGIVFSSDTWCNTFRNVNVYACHMAMHFPPGTNYGENFRFFGCTFFNSTNAVVVNAGVSLNFVGCAFDYNVESAFVLDGWSSTVLQACHIEAAQSVQQYNTIVRVNPHSNFTLRDSIVWMHPDAETSSLDAIPWLLNDGFVLIDNTQFANIPGNYFSYGTGRLIYKNNRARNTEAKLRPRFISWLEQSL